MSGWDKDTNGDYVPKPLPGWVRVGLAAAIIGFVLLIVIAT